MSVEPGAIWGHVYNEVTTKGVRYVQGGGCLTVGVVGLVLGGGFGSFSKAHGTAGSNLVEAEVVTADGEVKIANACTSPDLFWALKGGGGGFGIVTRVTLRTHDLPVSLGVVFAAIKAASDDAYRRLVGKAVEFYAQALFNPHWGEQLMFAPGGVLSISMLFQGLDQREAEATWRPFFDWVAASGQDFKIVMAPKIIAGPALHFWDPAALKTFPGFVIPDDRPGRRKAISSTPQTSEKRVESGTPINPPGCPSRFLRTISANDWPTRCSRRRSIAASRFTSIRGLRERPPRRSPRRKTRR